MEWRDIDIDKSAIFSTWREQRWRYLLGNLPEETELKTKMHYSLPGENKDGGKRQRKRQKCNILYLERTKMEVFTLEHLPEETDLETKM
jgi:hypothetical protein